MNTSLGNQKTKLRAVFFGDDFYSWRSIVWKGENRNVIVLGKKGRMSVTREKKRLIHLVQNI